MLKSIAVASTLVVAAGVGFAAAQSISLEEIAKQPNTEIVERSPDGSKIIALRRDRVTIRLRDGRFVTDDERDELGKFCVYEYMLAFKVGIDVCFPGEYPKLSSMLGAVVEAYNDYIVARNFWPITKADLQAYADKDRPGRLRAFDIHCDAASARNMAESLAEEYRSKSPAEFDRSLEAIRAETRPPAHYPCF
jgi:hypothetical protein